MAEALIGLTTDAHADVATRTLGEGQLMYRAPRIRGIALTALLTAALLVGGGAALGATPAPAPEATEDSAETPRTGDSEQTATTGGAADDAEQIVDDDATGGDAGEPDATDGADGSTDGEGAADEADAQQEPTTGEQDDPVAPVDEQPSEDAGQTDDQPTAEPERAVDAPEPTFDEPVAPLALEPGCPGWTPVYPGGFEIDGNQCDNGVGTDWIDLGVRAQDTYDDDTQFTGGASENDWPWTSSQTAGSSGLAKTDLGNIYAHSTVADGSVFGYLGFERLTKNVGTVAYWVELNQEPNASGAGPTPTRTDGDLRLNFLQTGNDTISLVSASVWSSDAWTPLPIPSGAYGVVNQAATTNIFDEPVEQGTFAEVAVNLTELFEEAGCSGEYGTMNIRSSASEQETAALRDWVAPIDINIPSTCASVVVDKTWVIDGEEYADGEQPFGEAALKLTGQTEPEFGTAYTHDSEGAEYETDDVVTIGEQVTGLPTGCANTTTGDIGEHTLTAGRNTFGIVNTVTCTYLSLEKVVVGGDALPDDWTLSATGDAGAISGTHGDPQVTRAHVAPGAYQLAEGDGPAGYRLTDLTCTPNVLDGDSVTLAAGDDVTCAFTNTAEVGLTVTKTWVFGDDRFADGEQPLGTAALTLDGEDAAFGETYGGYLPGDDVAIAETVTGLPDSCAVTTTIDGAAGTTATHTIAAEPDPNVVEVVNTVDCTQTLTLVKDVGYGGAAPQEWTLAAQGPDEGSGFSGTPDAENDAVSSEVPVGVAFALSESGGPAEYVQQGAWVCVDDATQEPVDSADAEVALDYGQAATCTVTNVTATLTLLKHIGGDDAEVLDPAAWTLTAAPGCAVDGLATVSTPGAEEESAANTAEVRPDCDYALAEEAADGTPLAYRQLALERWDADAEEWVAVDSDTVSVAPATHAVYRFVNDAAPAVMLPLTGGTSTDAYLIAGAGTLLAAGLLGLWMRRRRAAA